MHTFKVYLAGPHQDDDYREHAAQLLANYRVEILDPMRPERDFRGKEAGNHIEIIRGDLIDIARSDVVIANWTHPSVGTSMECWYAFSIGRPIHGIIGAARLSPWYQYIARRVHGGLAEAVEAAIPAGFRKYSTIP